jgi:hypothetical protein
MPEDRDLEQLLADTAALRQRYREASQNEPPAPVDEAIRAAARREVKARPTASAFGASWRIPASLAAVVVVSVTITVMLAQHDAHLPAGKERDAPTPDLDSGAARKDRAGPASASDALAEKPQPGPAKGAIRFPRQATRPPAAPEAPSAAGVRKLEQSMSSETKTAPDPAATELQEKQARTPAKVTSPAPAGGPAPPAAANVAPPPSTPPEEAEEGSADRTVTTQPLAKRRALAGPSELDSSVSPWEKDPEAWLAHIEKLQAAGRNDEAAASFRTFRGRYPDYRLPANFVAPAP